jgi:hypothetical protein
MAIQPPPRTAGTISSGPYGIPFASCGVGRSRSPPRKSVHKNVSTVARPTSSHTAIHPTHHRQGIIILLYRYSSPPIHPLNETRRHRVGYHRDTRDAIVAQHLPSGESRIVDRFVARPGAAETRRRSPAHVSLWTEGLVGRCRLCWRRPLAVRMSGSCSMTTAANMLLLTCRS